MMNLFDTHAHILDEKFDEDRQQVIQRIYDNMALVVNIGCNLDDCPRTVALAEQYDKLYAAVGLHPRRCYHLHTGRLGYDLSAGSAPQSGGHRRNRTGLLLGRFHQRSPKATVSAAYRPGLPAAKTAGHPRQRAHGDTLDILKTSSARQVGGILHAFSGSVEMALEVIKLGFYIGLGGPVTFKNARKTVEVAAAIPLDHLVIETDCPYMAPVPFRGKRNEPVLVQHTAEKIAQIRNMPVEELIEITYQNGKRVYGI